MSRLTLDDSDWEVRIRACEFIAAVWEHCLALDERADYRIRVSKRLKDATSEDDTTRHSKPSSWWFYDIKGDQILVEATRDSSRMVRLTSVEILKKMKVSIEQRIGSLPPQNILESRQTLAGQGRDNNAQDKKVDDSNQFGKRPMGDVASDGSTPPSAAYASSNSQHPHAKFYAVLNDLDFERLDATISVEQLYEEVLNVERVEDVVMAESENPNDGNNVLDCY